MFKRPEFNWCNSFIKQEEGGALCSESLIENLANKTKMAVGGNEDSLIGFLWINPLRRVRGVKTA